MNFENILITGIIIGAGIIYSLFSFFRYFFIGYAQRDRYSVEANSAGQSSLIFLFIFSFGIIFCIKYLFPNRSQLPKSSFEEDYRKTKHTTNSKKYNRGLSQKTFLNRSPSKDFSRLKLEKKLYDDLNYSKIKNQYMIQLGAYKNDEFAIDNAASYAMEYSQKSIYIFIDRNSGFTKILMGNFNSKEKARQLKAYLEKKMNKKLLLKELSKNEFSNLVEQSIYLE